jgi:DNA-binding NarL/FixJ family response regulator
MGIPASVAGVRVLVVDDSGSFREGVHDLINGMTGFVWAGEAANGEEGVEQTLRLRPDLVVIDVRMPGAGGIEAATRIASQATPPPVVILVTAADLPIDVPRDAAAEVVGKERLSRDLLEQVWVDHGDENRGGSRRR